MESLRLLGELFKGYFTHGWFFAFFHLWVGYLFYRSWRQIQPETLALQQWDPASKSGSHNSKSGETTQVLDLFVEESKRLGPQGFFVLMTDYSDRLDSIVDGLLAELHDRTNLFLLVGIAGTIFGVFEFSFKSYEVALDQSVLPGERVQKLGEYLSESMSKAFPVGFMGLLLTFASQAIAAKPERKLRKAVSKATQKALECRREDSVSQAEIVLKSTKALEKAMEPLLGLDHTLTMSLNPVVEKFADKLQVSLELVKTQFGYLEQATVTIFDAVKSINQGVSSLEKTTDDLKLTLSEVPKAIKELTGIQEAHRESLDRFDDGLTKHLDQAVQIRETLDAAAENINRLPASFAEESQAAFQIITGESLSMWKTVSGEFKDRLQADYHNLILGIGTRAEEIEKSVEALSQELKNVAEVAEKSLQSITGLPDGVLQRLDTAFGSLSQQSASAWEAHSNEFNRRMQDTYLNYAGSIERQTEKIGHSLEKVDETWGRIAANSQSLIQQPIKHFVEEAKNEIRDSLRDLDQLFGQRLPKVSHEVQEITQGLEKVLLRIQDVQREYTGWLDGAHMAQERIRNIHSDLVTIQERIKQDGPSRDVAELLRNSIEQLKGTNRLLEQIQNRMPGSGNGLQAEFQTSVHLLREIRNGVDDLAHKEGILTRVVKWPWSRKKD